MKLAQSACPVSDPHVSDKPSMEALPDNLRQQLARELHDGLGQFITTLGLYSTAVLSSQGIDSAHQYAAAMKTVTADMACNLRNLLAALRNTQSLDHESCQLGDIDFDGLLAHWQALNPHVTLDCAISLDPGIKTNSLYECFQILNEALINITRHADASRVLIHVGSHAGQFRMRIEDDGAGFNPEHVDRQRFGLLGMQERAARMGATLKLTSMPGKGTRIDIQLPMRRPS